MILIHILLFLNVVRGIFSWYEVILHARCALLRKIGIFSDLLRKLNFQQIHK